MTKTKRSHVYYPGIQSTEIQYSHKTELTSTHESVHP
jgi:hypothetical protein